MLLDNQELLSDMMPVLIPVGIALLVMAFVAAVFRRLAGRLGTRLPQHEPEIRLVGRILTGAVSVIIIMTLLESLNVPLGNVWTAVSTILALVAIGFVAVWSLLSHMTAAVVLFLRRPFRSGDYIQFADDEYVGQVIRTGLFFTLVRDDEGGKSHIPNNLLFQRRFRVTSENPGPSPLKT